MKRAISVLILITLLASVASALGLPGPARAADAAHPARLPMAAWISPAGQHGVVLVNVRGKPGLHGPVVARQAIGAPVTVYAVVKGDAVQPHNPYWYRISPKTAAARYVYSQYVSPFDQAVPDKGKLILISLSNQWLIAFDNGRRMLDTPVTTGRPELPTPTGTFHVQAKYTPYQFISPWPVGSPYYYPPSWVHYAMQFRVDGYFIHDAPWRSVFGPGTNLPHDDPGDPLGSHGCVNLPAPAAKALFDWAGVGTTIRIIQ